MPETVLERHYRDRVESVRQIARADESNGPRPWQFYADLVNLCFELSVSGRALLEQEYKRAFKEHNPTIGWLRERRKAIEELSDSYVQLAEAVRAAALHAWNKAGAPPGNDVVSGLNEAIKDLVYTKQSVLDRWPVGTDEETAAAAAAAARGEGLEV